YQLVSDPQPGRTVTARVWTTKDGLASNAIISLFQASDGRLWIGTNGGLSELLPEADREGRRFRSYSTANGLSDNVIIALGEDRDGNLWIGGESGGVMKLAVNGFTTYGEEDGVKAARIVSLFFNRAGELCTESSSDNSFFINRLDGPRF